MELDPVPVKLILQKRLVRQVREEKGIARSTIAAELGVHENTIANWERLDGTIGVPAERLRQLEKVFELPAGWFDDVHAAVGLSKDIEEIKADLKEILGLLRRTARKRA